MSTTSPTSLEDIKVFDPDTYANGDPTTFGLPLDQYTYLRDELPCYVQTFDDPMLIDKCWVLTRHEDCFNADRDTATFALDRGFFNTWRIINIDPIEYPGGKPAMLTMGGDNHRRNRAR